MNNGNVLRVDRHATIGQKELLNEYVNNNKPCLLYTSPSTRDT